MLLSPFLLLAIFITFPTLHMTGYSFLLSFLSLSLILLLLNHLFIILFILWTYTKIHLFLWFILSNCLRWTVTPFTFLFPYYSSRYRSLRRILLNPHSFISYAIPPSLSSPLLFWCDPNGCLPLYSPDSVCILYIHYTSIIYLLFSYPHPT